MKILLTNDDGIHAPGIAALKEVAEEYGEVWIFAPATHVSGASHQLTWDEEVQIEQHGEREFAIGGFPTDCIRMAFCQFDIQFDWVLSGINNGGNMGSDIYMSGTVAGAREAALHGCHAIALSQHRKRFMDPDFDWSPAKVMTRRVLSELVEAPAHLDDVTTYNVNFPDVDMETAQTVSMKHCELDRNPLPFKYEEKSPGSYLACAEYNQRARSNGFDVDICFSGNISISGFDFVSPKAAQAK